jgi:hypothetical protein
MAEMSRPMTFKEFSDLANHVAQDHSPFSRRTRKGVVTVKYMDPVFDFRSNTVFSVTFRTFGGCEIVLHCQNECRDLEKSLYERCREALHSA